MAAEQFSSRAQCCCLALLYSLDRSLRHHLPLFTSSAGPSPVSVTVTECCTAVLGRKQVIKQP